MRGHTAKEVERLLGLSASQIRRCVRVGFVAPQRGIRGELRFTFQDLVLLRAARSLLEAKLPEKKIQAALQKLAAQLPEGRPLSGVRIEVEGGRVVVQDNAGKWQPDSGQALFDFEVSELERKVATLAGRTKRRGPSAEEHYDRGCELEEEEPKAAREQYRRALELEPGHADAHVNLGRLLHDGGDAAGAEAHYRQALAAEREHGTAAFNLGVALEDLGRLEEAAAAYLRAIEVDARCADAHYNLSRICERLAQPREALRHLRAYKRLIERG